MDQSITDLKQQRLQKLFDDCQQQVISQIIGPFGLSTAMFEDRNGGNVSTLRNFSREDADYIADKDVASHKQSRKDYDREEYSDPTFAKKSQEYRAKGKDGYTGNNVAPGDMDLDHVTPLKDISKNKKVHLALETGEGMERVKQMANAKENLVPTHKSINRSKRDSNLDELEERKGKEYGLDPELVAQAKRTSEEHIASTVDTALMKKQSMELLQTGGKQAAMMGMRQALGLLLTELVNGLFNEFKVLIQQGVEAGKTLFEAIRQRLARVIESVVKKIPDVVGQMFQGSISGFMSNLLTFLINNFLSTAKRFVTVIREGLLGLFRAFKMIFFPPKHMTGDQALQEGLKILATVVVASVGLLLNETVATFMATVPFLKPFADLITPVLIGIMTGLLSAFLAYQIDCLFDRYRHSLSEKFIDELLADARRRDEFANELVTLSESSLGNIENYSKSITVYQNIGVSLGSAGLAAGATLDSLEKTVAETREQVANSFAMIDFINASQAEIEDFLKTL
jgi:ribosomal protein L17